MIGDQLEGNLHQADETNPFGWCYIDFVLTNINECGDAIRLNNLRVLQGYHLDMSQIQHHPISRISAIEVRLLMVKCSTISIRYATMI